MFFRLILRWLPVFVMMVAIFAFSSVPFAEMPSFGFWDLVIKKGGHALGYGLLALACLHALSPHGYGSAPSIRFYIYAWLLAVLYSATDEFHQSFVPGRTPALLDVLIDSFGAAAALSFWFWRSEYFKQTSEKTRFSHS